MNTADDAQKTTHNHNGRNAGMLIAIIIVATLVAIWLVPGDESKHEDIPLPAAEPAPVSNQAAAPAVNAESGQPAIEYQEGQEAREFIAMARQQGTPIDTLFERAEEFRQSGKTADAHLLYFQAARQGHAGACMVLAKQADPAFYSPDDSMLDKPYVTQARKWYLAAAGAGDGTATELLENLHNHVRTQAAAGNPEANRLLLQWK